MPSPKEHLLKAIELDPGFADAWYQLALILLREGVREQAAEHLSKVLELDADHASARLRLATLQTELGQPGPARAQFEILLENDPRNARAHYHLGLLALQLGNSHDALYHLEKTSSLNPDNADAHYRLGLLHDSPEDFEKARFYLQSTVDFDPTHVEGHFQLGLHLRRGRRYDESGNLVNGGFDIEAREWFETAIRLDPSHAAAHEELARLFAKTGETGAAQDSFTSSIQNAPSRITAYLGLASLQAPDVAIQTCAEALNQDAAHPAVHLRKALFHLANKETSDARHHFEQAAENAIERIRVFKDEALEALTENRFIPSRKKEKQATELSGHRAEALFQLGLLAKDDASQRRQHFEAALAIDSQHPGVHHQLAILQHEAGDNEAAIESLRKSVEIEIQNPDAHFLLAGFLLAEGDQEMARNHYLITLDLASDHKGAKKALD